ncbi:MAG: hypothetical protein ACYTGP_03870 [Planctomycetota bacterium]
MDVLCRACGYNLHGLDLAGMCPECSAPIRHSLRGDLLQYGDLSWLERLRTGLLWIVVGIIAQNLIFLGLLIVSVILSAAGSAGATSVLVGFGLAMGGVSLVYVIGVWQATEREPRLAESEPPMSARRLARLGIVTGLVGTPLQALWQQGGSGWFANVAPGVTAVFVVFITVLGVFVIAGWVAFLVHLRRLALRIPGPRLARHARIVMFGYAFYMSVGLIVAAASFLAFPGGGPATLPSGPVTSKFVLTVIAIAGGCVMIPFALLFEVWGVVLYFFFRRVLKGVADEARTLA